MALLRSKKALMLYPLILSLFTTTIGLGIILKPKEGWTVWAGQAWEAFKGTTAMTAKPVNTPTSPTVEYRVDAELEVANSNIHGVASITVPNSPDDTLLFYLYPSTHKPIEIKQVLVNGGAVRFQATPDHLLVPVKAKGETANVQIQFSTPIPAAGTRLGQQNGVWSLTYWYPILGVRDKGAWIPRPHPHPFGDPFLMDLSSYQVRLKHPQDFVWFASGALVSSTIENGMAVSEWKADSLRSFALIGGSGWDVATWRSPEGVDVKIAVRNPRHLPELKTLAEAAVKTYTKRFGALAYPYYSVVEMPTGTVFAHEYPNLALFSQEIWNWTNGEHWIAHEIAHGWWFSSVGTHKALDPWLDEGLADYASLLYNEAKYGRDAYNEAIARYWTMFRDGKSNAPHSFGRSVNVQDESADQPYANFSNEADYYYLMYLRPALMYHDLRMSMGDPKFFDFLQQFYLKNRKSTVTRADLEESLSKVDPHALPRLKLWLDAPNKELIEHVKTRFTNP
ncbi:M1 family aminopeptidase [Effusibacillus consociatus]|uniref:M1 family aminopeptidase n=1 Tax=Effusibacillus consociatus TaxID=1117041 RepID=A0ABV9Q5U1_9BACL